MGKNDIYMKQYFSDKARFADLFNHTIFQGETRLKPEGLREINSTLETVLERAEGKATGIQQYRDIIMEYDEGQKLLLLAIENQEEVHYAMPVRSMLYDALNYTEQIKNITKNNRIKRKLKGSREFLSGIRKEDRLKPVISLVFYYGNLPWDGSKDIHGLLDIGKVELKNMSEILPNYRMNLVDVKELVRNYSFKTDLQWIFGMLQYKNNKEELLRFMNRHKSFFGQIDEDTFKAAKVLLGAKNMPNSIGEEKRGINMCKALDDLYRDGIKAGRRQGVKDGIERGIEQGEARFRSLCKVLLESGKNEELEKAVLHKEYCEQLYKELQL